MRKGEHRFHLLDVFTDRAFGGARLALFEGGAALTPPERDAIAREIAAPAVAFLDDSRDPLCAARLHVHAAGGNEALLGHAEIGAAIWIAQTRAADLLARNEIVVVLEREVRPTRCEVIKNRRGTPYAQHMATLPQPAGEAPGVEVIARALGLGAGDIGFDGHEPAVFAAPTRPIVFVPIIDRNALDAATPGPGALQDICVGGGGVYLYARETEDPDCAIRARFFAAPFGEEDAATGCAVAAFAGVAMRFETPEDGEHQLFVNQANRLGRPARLTLRMTVENGRLTQAQIGGQAVILGEGVLRL